MECIAGLQLRSQMDNMVIILFSAKIVKNSFAENLKQTLNILEKKAFKKTEDTPIILDKQFNPYAACG